MIGHKRYRLSGKPFLSRNRESVVGRSAYWGMCCCCFLLHLKASAVQRYRTVEFRDEWYFKHMHFQVFRHVEDGVDSRFLSTSWWAGKRGLELELEFEVCCAPFFTVEYCIVTIIKTRVYIICRTRSKKRMEKKTRGNRRISRCQNEPGVLYWQQNCVFALLIWFTGLIDS